MKAFVRGLLKLILTIYLAGWAVTSFCRETVVQVGPNGTVRSYDTMEALINGALWPLWLIRALLS